MGVSYRLKYAWKKGFWFFAKPIRKGYRYLRRPIVRGVKVVIVKDGNVLLVRPNYGHRLWTTPGGAVEHGESYDQAARREVMEEVGLATGPLTLIKNYEANVDFARSINKVFATTVESSEFAVDGIEIKEAGWFRLDQLPHDRRSRVDERLKAYKNLQ